MLHFSFYQIICQNLKASFSHPRDSSGMGNSRVQSNVDLCTKQRWFYFLQGNNVSELLFVGGYRSCTLFRLHSMSGLTCGFWVSLGDGNICPAQPSPAQPSAAQLPWWGSKQFPCENISLVCFKLRVNTVVSEMKSRNGEKHIIKHTSSNSGATPSKPHLAIGRLCGLHNSL